MDFCRLLTTDDDDNEINVYTDFEEENTMVPYTGTKMVHVIENSLKPWYIQLFDRVEHFYKKVMW